MHIYIYLCPYMYTYKYVYIHMYVYVYINMQTYMYNHMYVRTCVHVHVKAHGDVDAYLCICKFLIDTNLDRRLLMRTRIVVNSDVFMLAMNLCMGFSKGCRYILLLLAVMIPSLSKSSAHLTPHSCFFRLGVRRSTQVKRAIIWCIICVAAKNHERGTSLRFKYVPVQ